MTEQTTTREAESPGEHYPRPCPFCGLSDAIQWASPDGGIIAVACGECGAIGPTVSSAHADELAAAKAWNNRPASRRTDSAGRDVTDLPGLWDEGDTRGASSRPKTAQDMPVPQISNEEISEAVEAVSFRIDEPGGYRIQSGHKAEVRRKQDNGLWTGWVGGIRVRWTDAGKAVYVRATLVKTVGIEDYDLVARWTEEGEKDSPQETIAKLNDIIGRWAADNAALMDRVAELEKPLPPDTYLITFAGPIKDDDGNEYEPTGEYRVVQTGDWCLSRFTLQAVRFRGGIGMQEVRIILRRKGALPEAIGRTRMIVCETCGNKRCPHATDTSLACTGSNAPGQAGSKYGGAAPSPGPGYRWATEGDTVFEVSNDGTNWTKAASGWTLIREGRRWRLNSPYCKAGAFQFARVPEAVASEELQLPPLVGTPVVGSVTSTTTATVYPVEDDCPEALAPWRTPTDEDAKRRLKCQVRHINSGWSDAKLLAVLPNERSRFVAVDSYFQVECFEYCQIAAEGGEGAR